MYKDKKILGLIPARGGSKGLPRKNIRPLHGKPLIAWTIGQAKASGIFDKIIVSTDDEEIAAIAKEYGAQVPFMRPAELAGDTVPAIAVVENAIKYFEGEGKAFDYLALLEPTSPMRKKRDIDDAIRLLIDSEGFADSLVSIGKVLMEHPAIMKRILDGYLSPYEESDVKIIRRQDAEDIFTPYGVIYISKVRSLLEHKTFYQSKTIPFYIERWQKYEVDDIYDLMCIEAIMNSMMSEIG
jgi:CMP-N,N'-diacetyllegionaminic acid synthase